MLATFLILSQIEVVLEDMVTEAELSFIPCSFPVEGEQENASMKFHRTNIVTNSNVYNCTIFEV